MNPNFPKIERMKRILFICLCWPWLAGAAPENGWTTDYGSALQTAAKASRPLLLDFSATWCGPCQMMARTTMLDSNVVAKLGSFVKMKVDIDANAALAEKFGVHSVPTFVVLSGEGDELDRVSGGADPVAFGAWLNSTLSAAAFAAVRRESFAKEKQAILSELQTPDAHAVGLLLDYSFRKEKYYRDFAETNLKAMAQKRPAILLDFLNDRKLAVRILSANLLRDQLGPAFDFDPWEKTATRTVIIDRWRTRLASKGH